MANKHSSKEKHKSKHKKDKHKKHRKYKKHKKEKKERSEFSDSSESGKEWQKQLKREEWNFFDTILSDSNITVKGGNEKSTKRPDPEKPGQNIRELNPYWKDGGCGLPQTHSSDIPKKRISNQSFNDRASSSNNYESFGNSGRPNSGFLKPGEISNVHVKAHLYQRNWRKKDVESEKETKRESVEENKKVHKENSGSSKLLTNEELNKLAAKLMKAEIMGDTALVNKLKAELEAARRVKGESTDEQIKEKEMEVIIVERGLKKSYEGKQSHNVSKRQRATIHDFQGRVCYFPDDEKYSLKNLFEKEKSGLDDEISILTSKISSKNAEEIDDIYLEAATSNKMQERIEKREHQKAIKEAITKHKSLEGCKLCIDNRNKTKHLIISTGRSCYLCLPEEASLVPNHCLIVPLHHEISTLHLDEDVWSEIKTYQTVLTKMFLELDQDVIFFENARAFKHHPHCFIQCVPLEKETGDLAPIYFQKAIADSETEWSTNKKVVDFQNKDLRRSIPKGLPYFAVSFGNQGGFAHVIEDEHLFKRNFAEEVIGGMMDLDHKRWRKPQNEDFRNQRQKALEFLKIWKKYEFNENSFDSDSSSSD